jgi:hypothetical protein
MTGRSAWLTAIDRNLKGRQIRTRFFGSATNFEKARCGFVGQPESLGFHLKQQDCPRRHNVLARIGIGQEFLVTRQLASLDDGLTHDLRAGHHDAGLPDHLSLVSLAAQDVG